MKKKLVSLAVAGLLAAGVFAGCATGNETAGDAGAAKETQAEKSVLADSTEGREDVSKEANKTETTGSTGSTVIKIAASPTPHAEILGKAKEILADQGYDLQITEFDDYVLPNEVVESGEYDANYFQHIPYLDSFNEEKGTHIVNAGGIHYEPFGIYPGTKKSLDELADGDTIAVPNDTTNEARALLLLQDNGIITLKEGAGFSVAKDSLAYEKSDSAAAETYVNIIGVKEGNENSEAIKALVEVLKFDEIKNFINETYDGAVIPFEE